MLATKKLQFILTIEEKNRTERHDNETNKKIRDCQRHQEIICHVLQFPGTKTFSLEAASPAATPGHAPWDNICISKFIFAWGLHNQSQDCGCSMLGPGSAPRKVMENFSSHFLLMKDQNMKSICFISFVGTWQPAVSQCLQFAHFKPDVLKWVDKNI